MSNQISGRVRGSNAIVHKVLLTALGMLLSFHSQFMRKPTTAYRRQRDGRDWCRVPGARSRLETPGPIALHCHTTGHGHTRSPISGWHLRGASHVGNFKEFVTTGVDVHVSTTTEVNAPCKSVR